MPSLCNVADLPSRDDFKLLEEQGGRRTAMLFPPASNWTGPLDLWYKRLRDPPHSEPSSGTAAAPSGLSASKVVSKNQQDEEAHVGGRRRPLGM